MESSIFELVAKAKRFSKIELMNAAVGVSVFGVIFLVFFPYGDKMNDDGNHLVWMVGPPLIYFVMDMLAAVLLFISMKKELHPKECYFWILLQIVNLVLLTVLGFFVVYTNFYQGWIYIKLSAALIVLYCYKGVRVYIMLSLVQEMKRRCQHISAEANQRQREIEKY